MKSVKEIEIIFENCESVKINTKYIINAVISEFEKEIKRVALNSLSLTNFCNYVGLLISKKAKIQPSQSWGNKDVDYGKKRLIDSDDITCISIIYYDGYSEDFYVDWEDGENEFINKNQIVQVAENGSIIVCIGKKKDEILKEFVEINNEYTDFYENIELDEEE